MSIIENHENGDSDQELARDLFKSGKYADCLLQLENRIEKDSTFFTVMKSKCFYKDGRLDEAKKLLETGDFNSPIWKQFMIGKCYFKKRRIGLLYNHGNVSSDGTTFFLNTMNSEKDNAYGYFYYGWLSLVCHIDYPCSTASLQNFVDLVESNEHKSKEPDQFPNPDIRMISKAYYYLGISLMNEGKYERAAESFTKSIRKCCPKNDVYLYRGKCYLEMKDVLPARSDLLIAYEVDPNDLNISITYNLVEKEYRQSLNIQMKNDERERLEYLFDNDLKFVEKVKLEFSSGSTVDIIPLIHGQCNTLQSKIKTKSY